jgi:glycosyltransferase involved in cell wall biosynthesis
MKMNKSATRTTERGQPLTLSVVIPVFNERETVEELVGKLLQHCNGHEIVIVDDGSTDGTAANVRRLANRPGVRALFHPQNWGKGAAIRTALQEASGEIIVIQDADLEYDPADIERLTQPIVEGRADVVFGSRFLSDSQSACGPLPRAANRCLTALSNRFSGLKLTDMETGYKAFRRDVVAGMRICENRFGIEPELTAKIARAGWRVVEVPISYTSRSRAAGKKITLRDGLRAVYCIVRYAWFD